jgi:menaquinol-cytochrome c reductase iron-sulfur subunit
MTPTETISRRAMLTKVAILFNGIIGALLAIPIVGYVLSPLTRPRKVSPEAWLPVGSVDEYPAGQTRLATFRNPSAEPWDGKTADSVCWVRRVDGQSFQVFAINCAHLGCPVRWFPQSRLFMCPCHGGVYYEDGSRASGPPERGLFQYAYKVEDGKLFIKAGELPTPGNPSALVQLGEKLPCG